MALARLFAKLVFLFALVWVGHAPSASAQNNSGWSVCNRTSYIVQVATGRPEGGGTVVNGWSKVRPGACETVLPAPLTPGIYHLYAQSSEAHRGGLRAWRGDYPLCVEAQVTFAIESPPDCTAMGLDERLFRPVLIEQSGTWQTIIRETDRYSLSQAQDAGVQRLLGDADVFTGAIDGRVGPRTRSALRDFLDDKNLPANTPQPDLIDILEQVALDRARNVGLTLCNRTEGRVWSAIGRRRGDGWESRGWWMLEAGGCARVIDEPLLQTEHFVYGELMDEATGQTRFLSRGADVFCISRTKFAISGREDCEASAYRRGLFAATQAPTDRRLVFEFFERDFGPPNAG